MIFVKICGITNVADALFCEQAGADMLGFVFSQSPRKISPARAETITKKLGRRIKKVGVFVNESPEFILDVVRTSGLDFVQLHGNESPVFVRALKKKKLSIIKAIRLKKSIRIERELKKYSVADMILLDAYTKGSFGGTGRLVDYKKIKKDLWEKKILLAGGLKVEILKDLLTRVKPWALDVSSGVELRPGKKSKRKVRLFLEVSKKG